MAHQQELVETVQLAQETLSRRAFLKQALFGGLGLMTSSLLPTLALADGTPAAKPATPTPAKPAAAGLPPAKSMADGKVVEMTFTERLKTVDGLTPRQIEAHVGLYKGYVAKVNQIEAELAQLATGDLSKANATYHPYRELQVERTYALNGAILHEYYFENIGGSRQAPGVALQKELAKGFGSWDGMLGQLRATGLSMRGWAILAYCMRTDRLGIYGLDTHHHYAPINVVPLLVLDVYEHAYMIDFGTDRKKYLDVFVANIDWSVVEKRLNLAMGHGFHP